jgi:hypothetical protein
MRQITASRDNPKSSNNLSIDMRIIPTIILLLALAAFAAAAQRKRRGGGGGRGGSARGSGSRYRGATTTELPVAARRSCCLPNRSFVMTETRNSTVTTIANETHNVTTLML